MASLPDRFQGATAIREAAAAIRGETVDGTRTFAAERDIIRAWAEEHVELGTEAEWQGVVNPEPLFRVPAAYVREMLRERLTPLAPSGHVVTGHSLRYGGATALFAAGVRADIIARLGRWSTDQMVDLYARVDSAAASAAIRAAVTGRRTTPFTALATIGVPAAAAAEDA